MKTIATDFRINVQIVLRIDRFSAKLDLKEQIDNIQKGTDEPSGYYLEKTRLGKI